MKTFYGKKKKQVKSTLCFILPSFSKILLVYNPKVLLIGCFYTYSRIPSGLVKSQVFKGQMQLVSGVLAQDS
jgi:hypothetical protein